jgi:hypothetical protein
MRVVTPQVWILASMVHLVACAAPPAGSTTTGIEVQLPARPSSRDEVVEAWAPPLSRTLRLHSARTGQVVVAGSWTVHFELAPEDSVWLEGLRRQHHHVRVSWRGHELRCDEDSGYVVGLASKQRAEQALAELWPTANRFAAASAR